MTLETLIKDLPGASVAGNRATQVTGVSADNRRIQRGDIFVAIPGTKVHGKTFIPAAIDAGAAAIVCDEAVSPVSVPLVLVPNAHIAFAVIAATFFGHPSQRLTVIGITGTNGKTSTALLVEAILTQAGLRAASLGTLGLRIGGAPIGDLDLPSLTTPDALVLQRLFAELVARKITHVVMEVSSHALAQHRVDATQFDVGAFTNLTQDHLDFHESMDEYQLAKERLFFDLLANSPKARRTAIVNVDHATGEGLADRLPKSVDVRRVSVSGKRAQIRFTPTSISKDGIQATFHAGATSYPVTSSLLGTHNAENVALALAICETLGVSPSHAQTAVAEHRGAPGRLERVGRGDIAVFVDYAHTPDALARVLAVCREGLDSGTEPQRRLVVVFGCGGDRDRTKRPLMGGIASEWADTVVITSDNPRSEDAAHIVAEILEGTHATKNPIIHLDRAQAIEFAISTAPAGSIVLIAGKGHETVQIVGATSHPFDDRLVAAAALRHRHGTAGGPN